MHKPRISRSSTFMLCGAVGSIFVATACGGMDDTSDQQSGAGDGITTEGNGSVSDALWWRRRHRLPAPPPSSSSPSGGAPAASSGSCPTMVQQLGFGPCDLATELCAR